MTYFFIFASFNERIPPDQPGSSAPGQRLMDRFGNDRAISKRIVEGYAHFNKIKFALNHRLKAFVQTYFYQDIRPPGIFLSCFLHRVFLNNAPVLIAPAREGLSALSFPEAHPHDQTRTPARARFQGREYALEPGQLMEGPDRPGVEHAGIPDPAAVFQVRVLGADARISRRLTRSARPAPGSVHSEEGTRGCPGKYPWCEGQGRGILARSSDLPPASTRSAQRRYIQKSLENADRVAPPPTHAITASGKKSLPRK